MEQLAGLLRSPAERAEGAVLLVVGSSGCGKSQHYLLQFVSLSGDARQIVAHAAVAAAAVTHLASVWAG